MRMVCVAVLAAGAVFLPGCVGRPFDYSGASGGDRFDEDLTRYMTADPREPFTLRVGESRHVAVDVAEGPVRRVQWWWSATVLEVTGFDCEPAGLCTVEPARDYRGVGYATVVLNGARRVRARIVGLRPQSPLLSAHGYSEGPCQRHDATTYECGPEGWAVFFVTVVP